jgi:hypothetical protein
VSLCLFIPGFSVTWRGEQLGPFAACERCFESYAYGDEEAALSASRG